MGIILLTGRKQIRFSHRFTSMQDNQEGVFLSVNALHTLQRVTSVRLLYFCLLYIPMSIYLFLLLQMWGLSVLFLQYLFYLAQVSSCLSDSIYICKFLFLSSVQSDFSVHLHISYFGQQSVDKTVSFFLSSSTGKT